MALRFFVFVGFLVSLAAALFVINYRDYDSTKKITLEAPKVEVVADVASHAEKETAVVFTERDLKGKEIFEKTGKCITCHGEKAEGNPDQEAPRLAGQHDWYLHSQLTNFKSGERKNEKMLPYLGNLTEQDFQDVSGYLSKLK